MTQLIGRCSTALLLCATLVACEGSGLDATQDSPFAPGVDLSATAADEVEVAHRLVAAEEYELALRAFNRAALSRGAFDTEILAGLGSANLGLGRLKQAEDLLRRATANEDAWPEVWNNLGVVLMERGETGEAIQIFKKAFALDDGESTLIRDNLRLALANSENSAIVPVTEENYKLVRRGSSDFLLRPAT